MRQLDLADPRTACGRLRVEMRTRQAAAMIGAVDVVDDDRSARLPRALLAYAVALAFWSRRS